MSVFPFSVREYSTVGGIVLYCKRLAKIYEDEEQLSGMPICMSGFCLFDEEHTTSMPLDLAYKAVQLTAPDKAERFLYLLRYATIVNTRPTPISMRF